MLRVCLPGGSYEVKGMGTVESVLVGGLLWLGGNSLVVSVWRSVRDAFSGKTK